MWKAVVGVSVVIGLVAALFVFAPRVGIDSSGEFDASDPLSVSFKIKNDWVLGLRDVTPFVGLCEFLVADPPTKLSGNCIDRSAVRFTEPGRKPQSLEVGEPASVSLSWILNVPSGSFAGGDITVGITFEPWIIPFHMERKVRFIAKRQRNGKFLWTPEPLDAS